MDVCRLLAIVAGEEQPVRTDDREVRHRAILSLPSPRQPTGDLTPSTPLYVWRSF
jgi:hypothetical protein